MSHWTIGAENKPAVKKEFILNSTKSETGN
jgi:hypothetical protein